MATLLLGDCLTHLKALPDKSVDCFVCDLPYGQLGGGGISSYTGEKANKYKNNKGTTILGCAWDVKIDLVEFWKQVKRLCKDDHTPVLMFCNTKFGNELINSNTEWFRYDLVWNKERGGSFLLANRQPMRSHEMIYIFSKKGAYYKRIDNETGTKKCPLSVINESYSGGKGTHPTEKPTALYKWLLERYCPAGGTLLDPTAGSFNCIQVAKELGLKGIGIEKDAGFFWKATARFARDHNSEKIPGPK